MMSTMEKVLFLKSVDLFAYAPLEALLKVAHVAHDVDIPQGEKFIHQGESGDSLFIVVEGQVDIIIEGVGKITSCVEGEVIGEMAILANRTRTASCQAATPVHALKIERADFWELVDETRELVMGAVQVLLERLDKSNQNRQPLDIVPAPSS
jgi:CRP-like cAMP-binding protein